MMAERDIHTFPHRDIHRVLKRDILSLNGTETEHIQQALCSLHKVLTTLVMSGVKGGKCSL